MIERPSPVWQPWGLQAIRDLTKTMTRRVMKPQPPSDYRPCTCADGTIHLYPPEANPGKVITAKAPHGQPGVEWYLWEPIYRITTCHTYDLTGHPGLAKHELDGPLIVDRRDSRVFEWQPTWKRNFLTSMYMPRHCARDFVTVSDVGAERLQDISEADAIAEGVDAVSMAAMPRQATWSRRQDFSQLWDSINAAPKPANKNPYTGLPEKCYVSYPWEDIREKRWWHSKDWYVVGNAWVWVYTFGGYERDPGRPMPEVAK